MSLGRSRLMLAGTFEHDDTQSFASKGNLAKFDLSRLTKAAKGRINAEPDTHSTLGEPIDAAVKFAVRDSSCAGLPTTGDGNVHLRGGRLLPSGARLDVAGNRASLRSSFGGVADRMHVDIDASRLARLQPGVGGTLILSDDVPGTIKRPRMDAMFRASRFTYQGNKIDIANGRVQIRDDIDGPLLFELTTQRVTGPGLSL